MQEMIVSDRLTILLTLLTATDSHTDASLTVRQSVTIFF